MVDDFLARCLLLDLETHGQEAIREIGAILGERMFERRGRFRLDAALTELDGFAAGADFILGHNLLGHDLPVLRELAPDLALHRKRVVDTLYLSPLAFPENPYHHLVKGYKLVKNALSDPLADARLAAQVFRDQWTSFARLAESEPETLAFYAFCLAAADDADGEQENGLAHVLRTLAGGPVLNLDEAVAFLVRRFAGRTCRMALAELAARELAEPGRRPAWAYVAAWLGVAGGDSVLPPWVRHRHPDIPHLLRALRDVPCSTVDRSTVDCEYCRTTHDPVAQLQRYFAFDDFRPEPTTADGHSLQEAIVRAGLAERPHLAVLATGAGKSLCYQLPALARYFRRGAVTVVISPLQALMKDQVDNLNANTGSDAAAALYGLLTPPERGQVLERLRLGSVALLYVAPEQLRNPSFRRVIEQREVGAWVFDEAHCLSKWGHDFRPDYLYAARFIRQLARRQGVPIPPVMAFTATAKLDVRQEIVEHFKRELGFELELFVSEVERRELRFQVIETSTAEKLERIFDLVSTTLTERPGSAVVYFATRRGAEQGAEYLQGKDLPAMAFHGGLETPVKRDVIDSFVGGEIPVVCATNAFGMGIDKDDVRLVVHADVPGSLENYLQEAGRAGRDRRLSDCVLLYQDDDVESQFGLAARSRVGRRDMSEILRAVRRAARQGRRPREPENEDWEASAVMTSGELLRDEKIETEFGVHDRGADTKVKTAVAWLERAGLLERDVNRINVFQGSLRLASLEEAEKRISRLGLSHREQGRWAVILGALINADPDAGLSADEIAELPGVHWPPEELALSGETAAQRVMRILHQMAEAGILDTGLRLTVYLKPRGPGNAAVLYARLGQLERAMLDLLAETEPEADDGDWLELSLRALNQRLHDDGHRESHPTVLRRLLRGLAEEGRQRAGQRGTLELVYRSRERYRLRLHRPWTELRELAARHHDLGRVVLERLIAKAPPDTAAKVLIEIGSEELTDAVKRDLVLRTRWPDPLAAVERALLFLHEQRVIQLQQGLAVFRQAMTLGLPKNAKGARYTGADYQPLEKHYEERNFQIRVMGRYARLGLEAVQNALALVRDYFALERGGFVERHFAGEEEILTLATGRESFSRIVDQLGHPVQIRLVAAPADANTLVLAGPGSGKTRVIVHRAAYLLRVLRVPARRVLVLCFNRNAALEVRRRLAELVGDDARRVTVSTYHGLAMRLTGSSFAPWGSSGEKSYREPDFSRLIPEAVRLLSGEEELLGMETDELRERLLAGYSHVLVDEYQDVNREQYELISAIAGRTERDAERRLSILAVGDDDQTIYGWGGASVEFIRRFRDDYRAEVHHLTENFRSTAHVIAAANRLIAHNQKRMKGDHPIVVDRARRDAPAGGRFAALDEELRGRVVIEEVDDVAVEAAAIAARIADLRRLDPALEWRDVAILARRHSDLEPVRAVLEERGVPLAVHLDRRALPPLGRLREFVQFLRVLEADRGALVRASALEERPTLPPHPPNPWQKLLEELLAEWKDETRDAETSVGAALEFLYEALAERRREPVFGDGVRLLTVHAAKGLEFPHVLMPGAHWSASSRDLEEERRLYYVGMTRARDTLHLFERQASRDHHGEVNPHAAALTGDGVLRRVPRVAAAAPAIVRRRYRLLGLSDLYLSFAGGFAARHPIHRRLAALTPGDELVMRRHRQSGGVDLCDSAGEVVAALSSRAVERWGERLDEDGAIESVRVLGLVERRAADSEEAYRARLAVERWEVPLLEVVYRGD